MTYIQSDAQLDEAIGLEAAEWLLRFDESDPDGEPEFQDLKTRNQVFYDWIGKSPDHLRIFLETLETHRHLPLIDANHMIQVEELLKKRFADVINLPLTMRQKARVLATQKDRHGASWRMRWRRFGTAAAVLLALLIGGGYAWIHDINAFTTSIGEQRTAKLDDGSLVYLNTDSRIEVDFSKNARQVRLARGEALFVVEHDSMRPFTVAAGDTTVRAIGTQFNVRRRAEEAEIAVIEGTVQVRANNEPEKLVAGQRATVIKGRMAGMTPRAPEAVTDTIAWRQRRLVFHDARLADVAEEFNRYNRTKIYIEGDATRDIHLSGIFDADRPQALMLYAAKNSDFTVQPRGSDWIIRGH